MLTNPALPEATHDWWDIHHANRKLKEGMVLPCMWDVLEWNRQLHQSGRCFARCLRPFSYQSFVMLS
jgi:hypothetical protein